MTRTLLRAGYALPWPDPYATLNRYKPNYDRHLFQLSQLDELLSLQNPRSVSSSTTRPSRHHPSGLRAVVQGVLHELDYLQKLLRSNDTPLAPPR